MAEHLRVLSTFVRGIEALSSIIQCLSHIQTKVSLRNNFRVEYLNDTRLHDSDDYDDDEPSAL